MTPPWQTIAAPELRGRLAGWIADAAGVVRVAVDGARCLEPTDFAQSLIAPLEALGRRAHHVDASAFWHDASLRLEHGHDDAQAYLNWLDAGALRREVLDTAATDHAFLPSLRDPGTNRSTRATPQSIGVSDVLLVSGEFLLGLGLPFDRVVHLSAPTAALRRRTHPDRHWTLDAHTDYAASTHPDELADVLVRCDRRHPVVQGLPC